MIKKNIWIINQYTGSPHYGMNYRSYYMAKEFVEQGHKVSIFSGAYSHLFVNLPKTDGMFTDEIIDDIHYTWVKTPKYKSSKSVGRVWNMLVFMFNLFFINIFKRDKPDVIIVSSLSIFPVLNAYIWSKIFKIDFIFEVRDIWPLTLIEMGNMSKYHPLVVFLGWFEKLGYKKAKYVVSVLPYAKEHMIKRGMQADKFRHIPNGINLDEVENAEEISDAIKKCIPKNKFVVGYVGTIGIANALEYLIEAANLLKNNNDIHFVLVGKGGELERLKKYCEEYELLNVTFIDPIPQVQIQSMLKMFDICYLGWYKKEIYKYGVSANKIFDYMYSGKPILQSANMKGDIIEQAKCGVTVESENSQAIKNAIVELSLEDIKKLDKMGQNGKEYVINYHSYDALARKYLELL